MYSRNYGITEDQKSKITPPPDYSGSAIQSVGVTEKTTNTNNEQNHEKEFFSKSFSNPDNIRENAPASQNISFNFQKEDKQTSLYREESEQKKEEKCEDKKSILKKNEGFLSGLTVEDIILFGIIAALAFGVADKDMLIIALVIATVIM